MFRNGLEPWHLIILLVVLVVVFGSKRLPEAARSLGRSARVFKSEMDEMKSDGKSSASGDTVKGETVERTEDTDAAPRETPSTGEDRPSSSL
jgi:sec-independent protein translocase protein TatA